MESTDAQAPQMNKPLVGAKRLPNGTLDTSRAMHVLSPLSGEQPQTSPLGDLYKSFAGTPEAKTLEHVFTDKKPGDRAYLSALMAKKLGISDVSLVFPLARKLAAERRKTTVPDEYAHYHRAPLEAAFKIIEEGGLLSRSEYEQRHPGEKLTERWSASDEVMMETDHYTSAGTIDRFGMDDPYIANIGPIVFVMNRSIMDEPSYDVLNRYPTVSHALLGTEITTVLVDDSGHSQLPTAADVQQVQAQLKQTFAAQQLENIQVMTTSQWRTMKLQQAK